MRTMTYWILLLVLCAASVVIPLAACQRVDYFPGKDTRAAFGNGRYQLLRGYVNGREQINLFDLENQRDFVEDVRDWRRRGTIVYLLDGRQKYHKFEYATGHLETYARLDDVPDEDANQFKRLRQPD